MLKPSSLFILCAVLVLSVFTVPAFTQNSRSRPIIQADGNADEGKDKALEYTTSWIGNTYGGNSTGSNMTMRHVPLDMNAIYVTPEGKVFTNVGWDEGGRPVSVFKDGKLVSPLNDSNNSTNWSNGGGQAVAADEKYIYAAQSTGFPGGSGVHILDVQDMSNTGLSLTGSINVYNTLNIFGLAIHKNLLYVSENDFNVVEVFDTNTLAMVNSFSIENPVRIAVDGAGGLWVTHRDPTPAPATAAGNVYNANVHLALPTIDHYDQNGVWLNSITLPVGGEAAAIAVTPWDTLLVGDAGPDLNVKIYANITKNPSFYGTFGKKGGIYSSREPGEIEPLRFRGFNGLGADNQGNIYVAQSGAGLDLNGGGGGAAGVELQSYTSRGVLNWQVQTTDWISLGAPDPHDEDSVYDAYHRYKMEYSKPPGKQWTYVADTYDRFLYPDDIRVTYTSPGNIVSRGEIHYLNGKKFLFVLPQHSVWVAFYRFDNSRTGPGKEIPIPCGGIDYGSPGGAWQDWVVQPLDGEFIWRDLNGNGHIESNEFLEPSNNAHRDGDNFWVDSKGDIWQINYNSNVESSTHIRRYLFQGLDEFGAPLYDFDHTITYNVPTDFPDFTDVGNMAYFPSADGGTLYVSGNTPGQGAFSQIARYDKWDKGNRKATWVISIPWNNNQDQGSGWAPAGWTIAGDFIFVDFQFPHYNLVYHATDGAYVGRFVPGKDVGGTFGAGNTDMSEPNMAFVRSNGEYLLFQEEDFQAKILMYQWTPPKHLPKPPTPQPPTGFIQTGADDEVASFSWTGDPNAVSYILGSSQTSGGPYTKVVTGVYTTSTTQIGVQPNGTWYYVAATVEDTGLTSQYSPEIVVSTQPAGTTYEAESGVLGGCAGIYAGAEDSGYYRVGCMAPGATITLSNVTVPTSGTYAMRIYYGNGDDNPSDLFNMGVIVNGGPITYSSNMPYTGDWSIPGYVTMNVQLNAGTNTIVLGNQSDDTSGGPDIDRIVVPSAPLP